jgi:hypothetical protein
MNSWTSAAPKEISGRKPDYLFWSWLTLVYWLLYTYVNYCGVVVLVVLAPARRTT